MKNHEGSVLRCVRLSDMEVYPYRTALRHNQPVTDITFSSASRSLRISEAYRGNVHLSIFSKSGKNIERVSKFGIYGAQNEQEVLFAPLSVFNILSITNSDIGIQIVMEEFDHE